MDDGSALIVVDRVSKYYPDGQVRALDNLSMAVEESEFVAVMGPSGSGKSTLLNLLGALDQPTEGTIRFRNEQLAAMGDLDRFRATSIGFVFQTFYLLPTLTAEENVQIPMFETPLSAHARRTKARELLDLVGVEHRKMHLPKQLSVGERQRVAIARALANDPCLLLADEPTGNLDSSSAQQILELFDKLHAQRRMAIVMITHDLKAAERANRTVRLRDGRIVDETTIESSAP